MFEGVCRPLKVRIEQALLTSPPAILCFHLLQLLSYYADTFAAILAPAGAPASHAGSARSAIGHASAAREGSALLATLCQLRDRAATGYHESLRARTQRLLRAPPAPPRSLAVPTEIGTSLEPVVEAAEAYERSMSASTGAMDAASDCVMHCR